jgi:uncharacterized protein (DUF427 family)
VWDRLTPTEQRTGCPYKGVARYWTHPAVADVAWSYSEPLPAVGAIRDRVAFFDEAVDVEVDGVAQDRPRTHFR